ncbi:MAG: class I SAM-dependent methyltransferase [Syntrophaceae bacterium]|nr:class I SAM-dependent methyltransferase [Syntrophaceae bacterium]
MKNAKETKKYVETCKETFWQNVFRIETDYLVSYLQEAHDILSVGCGPAIIEGKLSEKGFNVTGLDISAEALKCAPDNVRTVAGRVEEMSFPELSFDAVIYVASIQFVENYREALRRSFKVLRPEGKIIAMLLNPQSDFFKNKRIEPESYVNFIKHTSLNEIESFMAKLFSIQTEYILGIDGEKIFESKNPRKAALYVINGRKNQTMEQREKL